ncbi:MAG: PKD domain-containing protein [Actinomycetes bacterium]
MIRTFPVAYGSAARRWMRRLAAVASVALVGSLVAIPVQHAAAYDAPQTSIVTADPYNKTPNVLDEPGFVRYFAQSGNTMIAGGSFTQVESWGSSTPLTRNNIFSFDATSGQLDPNFAPNLDGQVRTLVMDPNGTEVFAGGEFKYVNGAKNVSIVKLRLSDGSVDTTFHPPTMNGRVFTLRYLGGALYVGGSFTTIGTSSELGLARVNPTTGAVDPTFNVSFTGTHHGGTTLVEKMDISPDGTRLAAIGNFTAVNGLDRDQAAVVDLTGPTPSVANWETDRFKPMCSSSFNAYVHDVEFSPDGSFFVIVATGAYVANSLCDAASRWESGATGTSLQPTWVNYTGGDTFWSVAITKSAVYVGGHNRWVDNPFVGDRAGQGSVYVSGLAALDPNSGVAFDWFPTRTTGVGVFDLYANATGLWVGHDTDWIGNEFHYKLAEFPLAGGKPVPNPSPGALPGSIYQFGQTGSAVGSPVLYRVNAGGPAIRSADSGPDWAADTDAQPSAYHGAGTSAENFSTVKAVNASVPSSTPKAVFSDDRTPTASDGSMSWSFPVAAGTPVEVRLYFANLDSHTSSVGARDFNVIVDGRTMTWGHRTTPYDIVKDVNNNTGAMKYFDTTSDGSLDLSFTPHINKPIVSAIEIVSICGTGFASQTSADTVAGRSFDGTTAGAAANVTTAGRSWSQVRGAFMLSGTLYTGWADGHLCAAPFDGSTVGPMSPVLLNYTGYYNQFASELPTVTAMFFYNNRVYYTKSGQSSLYSRGFSPEDNMVGPESTVVQSTGGGIDFLRVGGMFVSPDPAGSGRTFLYYTTLNDGLLHHIDWNGTATVASTVVDLGTGVNWKQQGLALYVPAGTVNANRPPRASLQSTCNVMTCAFTSVGSGDPDGTITSYAWTFGDGGTSTAATPTYTYAVSGTYPVTLTVTDNSGATNTATRNVSVVKPNAPPLASMTVSCTERSCQFDGTASSDSDGTVASYAWNFGDGSTTTGANASHAYASDGSYNVTLTVTDNQGATGTTTQTVNVAAIAAQVSFVGSDAANKSGTSWTVHVPNTVVAGDGLLVSAATSTNSVPFSGPGAGWSLVKQASNGVLGTSVWQKVAVSSDAGAPVTLTTASTVNAQLTVLAYRGTLTTNPVTAVAESNETTSGTSHTTPTVKVPTDGSWVVSLWTEKTSSSTVLTPPAGQTQRVESCGTGGGRICGLLTDGGAAVSSGTTAGGVTATGDAASVVDTMWTIVLGSAAAGPPNQPPSASFTSSCGLLHCSFDGTASSDPDGTIASYAWDFGDGTTDLTNTATPSHSYAAGGNYTVTLTVTDNRGGMATSTQTVTATAPITGISFVGSDTKDANGTSWTVNVPSGAQSGDGLILVATNATTSGLTGPSGLTGWSALQTLTTASSTTTVWQRVAGAGDAGQAVTLTAPATQKANIALLAYRGTNTSSPVSIFAATKETTSQTAHTTPTVTVPSDDSWVLSLWTDKSSSTTVLTPPGDQSQRTELCGIAGGHVCTLTADNATPVANGTVVGGITATADAASPADTMWTLVLGR